MSDKPGVISIDELDVSAFTIPTSSPEADGTLSWNQTTIVLVSPEAGGLRSLGYTYAGLSAAHVIDTVLKPIALRQNALLTGEIWMAMRRAVRNLGHPAHRARRSGRRPAFRHGHLLHQCRPVFIPR